MEDLCPMENIKISHIINSLASCKEFLWFLTVVEAEIIEPKKCLFIFNIIFLRRKFASFSGSEMSGMIKGKISFSIWNNPVLIVSVP